MRTLVSRRGGERTVRFDAGILAGFDGVAGLARADDNGRYSLSFDLMELLLADIDIAIYHAVHHALGSVPISLLLRKEQSGLVREPFGLDPQNPLSLLKSKKVGIIGTLTVI